MDRRAAAVAGAAAIAVGLGVLGSILGGSTSPVAVNPDWIHLSSAYGDLPVPGDAVQQTASLVFDVDGNGLDDFVIAARREAPALVWYRREVAGWARSVIEPDLLPIEAGGAAHDVDRDGDLDIVMGEDATGNHVYWWENPGSGLASAGRWRRWIIKDDGAEKHHDQIFGDFDDDGDAELVFWNQRAGNTLFIADVPEDPRTLRSWPRSAIFTSPSRAEGLAKADVDGDGRVDLVAAGRWFEYRGRGDYRARVIDTEMSFTRAAAGQLREGGYSEVVFVPGDHDGRLRWYEWTGERWLGHDPLGTEVRHGHTLEIVDLDGDGHLDVLCAEMHTPGAGEEARVLVLYGDGRGNFDREILATGLGSHESEVADLDGDGDLDVLVKPYRWQTPRVDVLLNKSSSLDRFVRHVLDGSKPWRSVFVMAGDLNGDGLPDVATGGWWYENPGGLADAWPRHEFGAPLHNVAALHDFDGDEDLDLVGTHGKGSEPEGRIAVGRNEGGGRFTVFGAVARTDGDFPQGAAVARFDDGPPRVALSWHRSGAGIQLLAPGSGSLGEPWSVSEISRISQDEALSAGDIDGDGRTDLLLGTKWLRNASSGWTVLTLAPDPDPDRNRLADLDGDGRLDAVVGFESVSRPGDVAWYPQPADPTDAWRRQHIATVVGPMSLDVGDLDADGDLDVVVGEHDLSRPDRAKLWVLENADGVGGRWIGHLVAVGDEHHDGALLADLDADGDLDVVSIGWSHDRVLVWENRTPR